MVAKMSMTRYAAQAQAECGIDEWKDDQMRGFLVRCGVTGIAVLTASVVLPGIEIRTLTAGIVTAVLLALLNAMVRPILYILSAPLIVLTFGLFIVCINALLLHLVSVMVEGFLVDGFWPAIGGAIVISVVSTILNLWISDRGQMEIVIAHRPRRIRHIN
ncbi:MAG: phage holin family protein [Nitrospirae bacterium]|nr:MAG: phage holin family protein [Nitrospirota bacterium]